MTRVFSEAVLYRVNLPTSALEGPVHFQGVLGPRLLQTSFTVEVEVSMTRFMRIRHHMEAPFLK